MRIPHFILLLFLFGICLLDIPVYAQKDTTGSDLSFDLGLTRDQDINVWPLLKYSKNKEEYDLQLMFTLYRNHREFQNPAIHHHFFPFYWSDSSKTIKDLRIGTMFYPSIAAYSIDRTKGISSFRFMEIAPKINLMEITKSPDGMYLENNFFFFIWYKNNLIDHKSHFVAFPLYWGLKNDFRTTHTLIPFFSKGTFNDNKDKYLAITPLYWRFRTAKNNKDVLFPVLWLKKEFKHNDTIFTKTVFPVLFTKRNKYKDSKVIFPLIWSQKSWYNSFTFFPLFSSGHSTLYNNSHLAITPLYWHFKTPDGNKTLLFPFWWNSIEEEGSNLIKSNVFFPLLWSYRDQYINNNVIFPIVWFQKNKNYQSFTLFPFISKGKSGDLGNKHLVITPLYWRITKYNSRLNVLFPLWYNKSKGFGFDRKIFNYIFPLYFDYQHHEKDNAIFFPFIWSLQNSKYQSFTLMPVFSYGHNLDKNKNHFAITPLYWHFKKQSNHFDFLFPIWWYKKKGIGSNTKYSHVIFPIYFSYHSANKNNKVLFPIIWSLKNNYYNSFTLLPIYSIGHSKDTLKKHFAVTAFFWHFENTNKHKNILFPIWWYSKKGNEENRKISNVIFPVYWSFHKKEIRKKVLFPLLWNYKDTYKQSFTFFPLFSFSHTYNGKEKFLVLTPFFWKIKIENKEKNILFPIFWSIKNDDDRNTVFFPFLWYNKDSYKKSLTVFPFFSHEKSIDRKQEHLIITPFFWKLKDFEEKNTVLFPIWWKMQKGSGINAQYSQVIFPLYWSMKEKFHDTKVLFPLVWKLKNYNYHSFTFFPLFSKGFSDDKMNKHLVITPLMWNIITADKKKFVIFPLFNYSSKGENNKKYNILYFLYRSNREITRKSISFLWPICAYTSDTNYLYFRFTPLLWYKKSTEIKYFTIQPFYYHRKNDSSENYRILWELYNYEHFFKNKKSNNILWKTFFNDTYENGDFETRFIYLLYANMNKNGFKEYSIFPFYYKNSKPNGNKTASWCFYFFNSIKREIEGTSEFYQEKRIFWLIRVRSNYQTLINKGIDKSLIKK